MRAPDPLLAIAALAALGPIALVSPLAIACVLAVLVATSLVLGVAPPRLVVVVATAAFALAGARAWTRLRDERREADLVARELPHPERCELRGRVVTMPRKRGVTTADVELAHLVCDGRERAVAGVVARLFDLPEDVARGDDLEAVVQLARARRNRNPDLGDPRPSFARRGYALSGGALSVEVLQPGRGPLHALDRTRARLRRGLEAWVPVNVSPIARALVLGEEDLAPDDDEAFKRSGLTHLLAVSGSHVALVVGGIVAALSLLLLRTRRLARAIDTGRLAALLGIPLALVYEQLAGDSGSARRATAMAVVVLLVRAAGRRSNPVRAVAASALAALAIDPLAPFDLSFTLSVCATGGLLVLGPPLRASFSRVRGLPPFATTAIATTLAASIACTPLVAGIAARVPLLSIAANVVAVPIGELAALPLCNVAALVGAGANALPPLAPLARLVSVVTAGALVALRAVANVAAAPDWAVIAVPPPTGAQLAILACALAIAYLSRDKGRFLPLALVAAAALFVAEIVQVRAHAPRGLLRITVLDVGQGDASIVDLPDGRVLLVDGGGEVGSPFDPGRAIVAPVLDMRRRRRLDVAVLTHPHPDHFLGLRFPLATREVSAFWSTGEGETSGGELGALYRDLARRGVPILRPSALCGAHAFGGATIEVLHPCPTFDPDRRTNDNSFVLRLSFGSRRALLVGDSEHEAETTLLARSLDLHADFLKVGHHGSSTSSSGALLARVAPSVAAISCGVRNRFGHPHRAALGRLGVVPHVLRTDVDGAIRWTTDGATFEVATAQEGW